MVNTDLSAQTLRQTGVYLKRQKEIAIFWHPDSCQDQITIGITSLFLLTEVQF